VISNRIRKIVSTDHDNQQSGKAAGDNAMWSSVFAKDAGRPYKLIGVVEEIYKHICIWIYTTMQATSRILDMQGRSQTAPSPRSDTLKGFASPHGLTLLGSNYARSPMTSRTRSRCQASRPSCQASHPSCQTSYPNHTHLLGHHDTPAPLLHSSSIKLSHALIFF